ncbi:MAG: hypothetical protein HUJ52_03740 [Malacoplasma sp.]|nr:hypothetical protein [Malacoplasma sp.]
MAIIAENTATTIKTALIVILASRIHAFIDGILTSKGTIILNEASTRA